MMTLVLATIVLYGCIFSNSSDESQPEPWEEYDEKLKVALANAQFDLAEENILKSISVISNKYPMDKKMQEYPIEYYTASYYEQLSNIYIIQGRYDNALALRQKFYGLYKPKMALYEIFWYYRFVEEIYQAQGKFDEARKAVDWLIESGDRGLREAEAGKDVADIYNAKGNKYWTAYPAIGDYYLQLGEYEKAIPYLKEHLDHAIKGKSISQNIAQAKNRLAMGYYYAGNDQEAEPLFREAGGLNARAMVGFPVDLAQSLTMLARIAGHRGQTEQAMKFFQSARQSLHMYRTLVYKVEESDILGQLGCFQLHQGNLMESSKAYREAIALRQATATATHPNCADAIKGLADVSAAKGELTSATLQATEALKILDTALVPTHPRISPELVVLASIHILSGQPEQAAPLFMRLETILQKPLGPWKEDFLETTRFYAELLKKSGKPAKAARLEQLYARQKNLR
jgi:tetratricopeptide (TPR) repeat protein